MSYVFPVIHKDFYSEFTPWVKSMNKKNKPREGVYILKSNKPVPRCLGVDNEGILYIGKGIILSSANRLGKFINALNATESAHGGGERFNKNKLLEKYSLESLKVEVILIENSRNLENDKLKIYQEKFGELPPLNNQN